MGGVSNVNLRRYNGRCSKCHKDTLYYKVKGLIVLVIVALYLSIDA